MIDFPQLSPLGRFDRIVDGSTISGTLSGGVSFVLLQIAIRFPSLVTSNFWSRRMYFWVGIGSSLICDLFWAGYSNYNFTNRGIKTSRQAIVDSSLSLGVAGIVSFSGTASSCFFIRKRKPWIAIAVGAVACVAVGMASYYLKENFLETFPSFPSRNKISPPSNQDYNFIPRDPEQEIG